MKKTFKFTAVPTSMLLPLLVILIASSVGCGRSASSSGQGQLTWSYSTEAASWMDPQVEDTFQQGFHLAESLARKVQENTLNTHGCDALHDFERGVAQGISTVQVPLGLTSSQIARFSEGENAAIARAFQQIHEDCSLPSTHSGQFVGSFFASLVCQSLSVHPNAVKETQWNSWITLEEAVCREEFEHKVEQCSPTTFSDSQMTTTLAPICRT